MTQFPCLLGVTPLITLPQARRESTKVIHTSLKGGIAKHPDLWKINQDPSLNPTPDDVGVETIILPDLDRLMPSLQ